MNAHWIAALLYLGWIHGELAHDPLVRSRFWDLLAEARYGFAETEEAMFIVHNDDGSLSFVRWTSMHVPHHAQWTAPIPRGAVAIVHTHPNSMPRPSLQDVQTSLRSNLPVYVITRNRIMKTLNGAVFDIAKGDWRPAA